MADSLGQRIFLAHLELSYRLGRKVTLAEFGEMIAKRLKREEPFTGSAVSRWESGAQVPTPQIIEAIGALTHTDPGWISHGDRSAAPPPQRLTPSTAATPKATPRLPASPAKKKAPRRRS
jgi:transcriptional regulator with XRE-family HTH domain